MFEDIALGRTLPDILNVTVAHGIRDLNALCKNLDELLRLAEAGSPEAMQAPEVDEMRAAMATRSEGDVDVDALTTLRRKILTATRRHRWQLLQSLTGKPIDFSMVPGLLGPPPGHGTIGDDTWQRNHLVQVLDGYPMATRVDGKGRITPVPPTDAEIAIVTLLAFRIKSLPKSSLGLTFDQVLVAERKAIHEARPRHAVASRMLMAAGLGSLHHVATGVAPKQPKRGRAKAKK